MEKQEAKSCRPAAKTVRASPKSGLVHAMVFVFLSWCWWCREEVTGEGVNGW